METDEAIFVEFQSTLDEIEEKTSFRRDCIPTLFFFELYRRENRHLINQPMSLGVVLSLYAHPSLLNYSIVEGPGAPIKKLLHISSTFSNEEKIKKIDYFCSYFLLSPRMPLPQRELEDSFLICILSDSENFYKIGLINPTEELGKKIRIENYDEGIINSEFCTFRKFYGCNKIYRVCSEELYDYTREKLKRKFENYENRSETLFKIFKPFYKTCTNFLNKQLEKIIEGIFREGRKTYIT